MVIYAEYLFIENFISGLMILYLTGKIAGMRTNKLRMIAGSVLCGLFSFVIFVSIKPEIISLFIKLIFAVITVRIVFAVKPIYDVRNFKLTLVFYIVTFLAGGITLASLYMAGGYGIAANGYVYMGMPTYFKVAAGASVSYIFIYFFAGFIRKKVLDGELKYTAYILIGEKQFMFNAYIDTGNHLRDPVGGKPVSVISKSAAKTIFDTIGSDEKEKRYCVIPFSAAGTKSGIMEGIRADKILVKSSKEGEDMQIVNSAIIAVYEEEFIQGSDVGKYEMLLNREMIVGGIV